MRIISQIVDSLIESHYNGERPNFVDVRDLHNLSLENEKLVPIYHDLVEQYNNGITVKWSTLKKIRRVQ